MMRFASLGSGSDGNGLLVQAGNTSVLADCGFTLAETLDRLLRLGLEPDCIDAIVVTHEHDDHVGGAARYARKFDVPVWLTHGTYRASAAQFNDCTQLRFFDCQQRFSVGDIEIEPYTVPHDAQEPSQFVFGDGSSRVGLLTDAGSLTAHMQAVLDGVDAIVLECNHDLDMLWNSKYPERLKQRIAGRLGHLDNAAAARLLSAIDRTRLKHVIAAHLSRQNNTPELARGALAGALGCEAGWVVVADQAAGFGWRAV